MADEKIFIGRYIGVKTKSWSTIDKFFLSKADVLALEDHLEDKGAKSGLGVNIVVGVSQKSGLPYLTIDTWKPDPNYKKNQQYQSNNNMGTGQQPTAKVWEF